jgi:hypothetical protein
MGSLTEIYKQLGANYTDTLKATQDAQANAIALDNARRAQQERMDLKALYAQKVQPSMPQLGAVSPEYAQAARKNELEMQQAIIGMQHQQAQTGDIERKANEESEKIRLGQAVAIVNQYDQDIESGMPEPQALAKYNAASGQALAMFKQRGMLPPNFPAFDPNDMNPEAVRLAGEGKNFYTEKVKRRQEYGKTRSERQANVDVGPVMTPEQFSGSVETDPLTGLSYQKPPLRRNQPAHLTGTEGAGFTSEQNAQFNVLQELLNAHPNDEALRRSVIAQRQKIELQGSEQPQSEIVTPAQVQTKRIEQKANEESAIKTAQIEATEKAADKKAIETYFRGPKPEAVRNLIKESIEGDVQSGIARLGKFFGVAVPGGNAKEALHVITQQMARALPYAPGSASDIDVKNRLLTVGNPASDEPITNRLRAMDEVFRDAEAYIVQKGELSEDQILDAVANGYLSESSAVEMINKGMKTSTGVK